MRFWTVITASDDQIQKLYEKYCKDEDIIKYGYIADSKSDYRGYVSLTTSTGKVISYQFYKNSEVGFIEFKKFGTDMNVRYDENYPEKQHPAMANFLRVWGEKARKEFWEGSEI